jgi:SAM-dependent methyltransferase
VRYFLDESYQERVRPEYFHDEGMEAVWQPDVYPEAATLARVLGSHRIVDLGCGDGSKLVQLAPEFEIVGVDFGPNIAACKERYDVGTWIEFDLDSEKPLPLDDFEGAVMVCADVIEHLVHPERVLTRIRAALDSGADAVVLSTPERDLAEGPGHRGPPTNPTHVREWNADELRKFLESLGLEGRFGLTRSNDYLDKLTTTFVVVPGPGAERAERVELWCRNRAYRQERAAEHAAKLERERERVEELAAANRWYQDQLAAHQRELAGYKSELAAREQALAKVSGDLRGAEAILMSPWVQRWIRLGALAHRIFNRRRT